MPRDGSGVYSKAVGSTASPNTTIESSKYNATIDDLVTDANAARPITAGGTGASTAAAARAALGAAGLTDENIFTKTQIWAKGADVVSANALTTGDDGNYFDITGATAITSIATVGIGAVIKLHFDAALTLTHHATDLILPGAANITTAAGDEAEFIEYATGDWRCVSYQRAASRPNNNIGRGAFRAQRNAGTNQTVVAASTTKVELDAEAFDEEGWYSTTTHRYTPLISGYYQISAGVKANGAGTDTVQALIYKNGALDLEGTYGIWSANAGTPSNSQVSGLVSMNGSTDYIELYAYVSGTVIRGGDTSTYLSGVKVA